MRRAFTRFILTHSFPPYLLPHKMLSILRLRPPILSGFFGIPLSP